mgnify:FL=1|tara:strand:- start:50 stop:1054 length:1005 start_codon:yes stop_codon:yes gene_type:complete
MSSKARLIECIDNIIIDEQNYIKEKAMDLKNKGYTVLDLHLSRDKHTFLNDTDWLKLVKNIQLRDFKTADPEYGFVLGAFGAFGNPASFHSKEIYALRYILFHKLKFLFKNVDPRRKLEMLFDRLAIRREGASVSGESFHRDTCSLQSTDDNIYGGWINLDDTETQYFSCVPGTHTCAGRGGFERIQGDYKDTKIKLPVKPKQVLIFNQNIIHEIFKQKIKKTNIRLYLGWRHTYSDLPLLSDPKDPQKNINKILSEQIVPVLPSGDVPFMYSKQHPGLHRHMVIKISDEIKDFYKIDNPKYPGGEVISRSLVYPINKITIPNEYKKIYYPTQI